MRGQLLSRYGIAVRSGLGRYKSFGLLTWSARLNPFYHEDYYRAKSWPTVKQPVSI